MPKGKSNASAKAKAKAKDTDIIRSNESEAEMVDHVVTEEDLAANPELKERGVEAGQTIQVSADSIVDEESEESEEEAEDESDEEEADEESDKDEASVYKENGEFVRTYSKSVHGKDFKKLAKEFAGKIGGSVK